jgi:CheY-like chemotaxis protein
MDTGTAPYILITEDDVMLRDMYKMRLEAEGFKIDTANNGLEALKKIKAQKPDLVLMDIMMPVMDGLTALKKIKSDPEMKNVPVVIMTVLIQEEKRKQGVELGAEDYLIKSETMPQDIVTKIKSIITKYKK